RRCRPVPYPPQLCGTGLAGAPRKRAAPHGAALPFSRGNERLEAHAQAADDLMALHVLLIVGVAILGLQEEVAAELVLKAATDAEAVAIAAKGGRVDAAIGIAGLGISEHLRAHR